MIFALRFFTGAAATIRAGEALVPWFAMPCLLVAVATVAGAPACDQLCCSRRFDDVTTLHLRYYDTVQALRFGSRGTCDVWVASCGFSMIAGRHCIGAVCTTVPLFTRLSQTSRQQGRRSARPVSRMTGAYDDSCTDIESVCGCGEDSNSTRTIWICTEQATNAELSSPFARSGELTFSVHRPAASTTSGFAELTTSTTTPGGRSNMLALRVDG